LETKKRKDLRKGNRGKTREEKRNQPGPQRRKKRKPLQKKMTDLKGLKGGQQFINID
jgi:hypothetical protein